MRNHDEIEIAIPRLRQLIGATLIILAVLIAVDAVPLGTGTTIVVLLLVAAGMMS